MLNLRHRIDDIALYPSAIAVGDNIINDALCEVAYDISAIMVAARRQTDDNGDG